MKVYLEAPAELSRAMARVAQALSTRLPDGVTLASSKHEADFVLLHVIGFPETEDETRVLKAQGKQYGIIQYCLRTTQRPHCDPWLPIWRDATIVWSYYDLLSMIKHDTGRADFPFNFYYAPLGVDSIFRRPIPVNKSRYIGVMTSGYVDHPGEAITDVALAAKPFGMVVRHLGPHQFAGRKNENLGDWSSVMDVTDQQLASLYHATNWVSGLRYGEGFELPALEGLCCGARPIVFDRPEMVQWYQGHAVFVPESNGDELIKALTEVFATPPKPVLQEERQFLLDRFDWNGISHQFWKQCLGRYSTQEAKAKILSGDLSCA